MFVFCLNSYSQIQPKSPNNQNYKKLLKQNSSTSFLPVSIAAAAVFYVINPILLYENKKLYAGFTKEFSVGFGKLGEHRFSAEYSFILGGNVKHHLRLSYKYDLLLKENIKPSHIFQGTGVVSFGAGYFTDFHGPGIFPEISYGYSIRNHKLLFYPHVKLRYTFMFDKNNSDKTDFSFGIIFGIANPFMDVKIRREY
jgi:hypothetical protein